jgi:hypothetical protein
VLPCQGDWCSETRAWVKQKKTALDYKKWMQPSTLASRKITQEKWLHGGGLLRWHWCLKKIDVIASMPWVLPQKVLALPDEDKA